MVDENNLLASINVYEKVITGKIHVTKVFAQATTGIIPSQSILSLWKSNSPEISYALGNSFSKVGYKANAYHNWSYTYYSREKTMKTLGYSEYIGIGNGLEKKIDSKKMYTEGANEDIKMGDTIEHETLGIGVVVKVDKTLIDVAFKTGVKKLMKNHKSIRKV